MKTLSLLYKNTVGGKWLLSLMTENHSPRKWLLSYQAWFAVDIKIQPFYSKSWVSLLKKKKNIW